jgi:hypothetical protein
MEYILEETKILPALLSMHVVSFGGVILMRLCTNAHVSLSNTRVYYVLYEPWP